MPMFTPNSTRIAEVPWNPTESGDYSLVARWESASDVMNRETADIDQNVRNNNNIVRRNVNIVTLGPP